MKTTMYYDGSCPVCMRGVDHFRRLDWAGRLGWVDLTDPRVDLAGHGLEFARAMDILHVRGRDGTLLTGGHAFVSLWAELPGYRWLGAGLRATGLVGVFDAAYRRLARGRYARRCEAGVCQPGEGA